MANCCKERLLGEAINLVACAIRTSLQAFGTFFFFLVNAKQSELDEISQTFMKSH